MKQQNEISNNNPQDYESFIEVLVNMASRLPQPALELLARKIHSAISSPKVSGPLFNFAAFINTSMKQDIFNDLVTGMLANFQRLMTSKKYRMDTANVAAAPPLSGPIPNLTLSAGDVDAIMNILQGDYDMTGNEDTRYAFADVENLQENRDAFRRSVANDPDTIDFLVGFGDIVQKALTKSSVNDQGFVQSMVDQIAVTKGKKNSPMIDPSTDFYLIKSPDLKLRDIRSASALGEGAIPVAIIAGLMKVGKFVVTWGPVILDLFKIITKTNASPSYVKAVDNSNSSAIYGKAFATLTKNATAAGLSTLAGRLSMYSTLLSNMVTSLTTGYNTATNAKNWRAVYTAASLPRALQKMTIDMMGNLAMAYKKRNPERKEMINLLTPRSNVPHQHLMNSVWDPIAIADQDVAWKDFMAYYNAAVKLNPTMASLIKGKGISSLESTFKSGSRFWDTDKSISDGWDDVASTYVKDYYSDMMQKFMLAINSLTKDAFIFSDQFGGRYANVTPDMVFSNKDYSKFKPWDKDYMMKFNAIVFKTSVPVRVQTNNVTTDNIVVKENDNPVITNTGGNDVPSNENQITNVVKGAGITGPSSGSDGTILITPDQTVVGMGHYLDPETGTMTDYNDLYRLGQYIRSMQDKASLYIRLPHSMGTGDPLEGGLLGTALNIGKRLLKNTKIGKKITGAVNKIASKLPVLKKLVQNKPQMISQVAQQSAQREADAMQTVAQKSLPETPAEIFQLLSSVQTLSEVVSGIDTKLDNVISEISRIQLGSTSVTNNLVNDESPFEPVENDELANDVPVSLGDVFASALSGERLMSQGDIDLWQILP